MARLLTLILSVVMMVAPADRADASGLSRPGWAALVIDVQPCFVTGGALAVAGADAAYVADAQRATKWLYQKGFFVFGSRDYHPADHVSFASNHDGYDPFDVIIIDDRVQVLWPDHCVQTAGDSRELVDNNLFFELVKKGQDPMYDSYSAFQDDGGAKTELHSILQAQGVTHLVVYGIATDYCVRASVIDALELGYSVVVVEDLIRGVAPDTSAAAIAEMEAAGAVFVPTVKSLK